MWARFDTVKAVVLLVSIPLNNSQRLNLLSTRRFDHSLLGYLAYFECYFCIIFLSNPLNNVFNGYGSSLFNCSHVFNAKVIKMIFNRKSKLPRRNF
jgi:hypothetical protein